MFEKYLRRKENNMTVCQRFTFSDQVAELHNISVSLLGRFGRDVLDIMLGNQGSHRTKPYQCGSSPHGRRKCRKKPSRTTGNACQLVLKNHPLQRHRFNRQLCTGVEHNPYLTTNDNTRTRANTSQRTCDTRRNRSFRCGRVNAWRFLFERYVGGTAKRRWERKHATASKYASGMRSISCQSSPPGQSR